ncbi:MAG: hypothetical protein U0694_14685 [Anaerolineae bacterium]
MKILNFADIETEFIQRVHTMVWCNVATIDSQQRPRSRILHPIWEGAVGWICTHRTSFKSKHLAQNPYVSLAYVRELMTPVYVDGKAEWVDDLEVKRRIWDLFKNTPPPARALTPRTAFNHVEHRELRLAQADALAHRPRNLPRAFVRGRHEGLVSCGLRPILDAHCYTSAQSPIVRSVGHGSMALRRLLCAQSKSLLRRIDPRLWLIVFGAGFGVLLALLIRPLLPVFVSNHHIFTEYDGDTFRHQPGQVRPPAENHVLEDLYRQSDANGFRLPALTADFYPILAIGDSFTDGGQVPWVDVLASRLNIPVQNLGWSGFGPLEYEEVMRQFGTAPQGQTRQWVLIAYFEGNDLSNTQTAYLRAQENGGVLTLNLQHGTVAAADPSQRDYGIVTRDDDNYLYPLDHVINGTNYPLAYISDYIWWLNGTQDLYRQSRNVELLRGALRTTSATWRVMPASGWSIFPTRVTSTSSMPTHRATAAGCWKTRSPCSWTPTAGLSFGDLHPQTTTR